MKICQRSRFKSWDGMTPFERSQVEKIFYGLVRQRKFKTQMHRISETLSSSYQRSLIASCDSKKSEIDSITTLEARETIPAKKENFKMLATVHVQRNKIFNQAPNLTLKPQSHQNADILEINYNYSRQTEQRRGPHISESRQRDEVVTELIATASQQDR